MRRVLTLLLLLACASSARATNAGCEYLLYPHLNFTFCFNHCRRSDTAVLRYTGLMEALNAHLERRIAEGKLADKTLEIVFIDPIADAGMPMIELTQNRRGYHITSRHEADLNLQHLVRIVDSFAAESWRPFVCCRSIEGVTDEEARRRLSRFLVRTADSPDLASFAGRRSIVFELGDLQVVYEDDRLSYVLAGQKLDPEPADPIPVQVGNRYLFGSPRFFHIYENGTEIQRSPKPDFAKDWGCDDPILARAHRKWINIGCVRSALLSYSSEHNRFYEVKSFTAEEGFHRARCSDEPGAGEVHPPPVRVILPAQ